MRRDERPGELRTGVRSQHHLGYRAWWDLPPLPKLNVGSPAVREYLFGVAEHWIRFGVDGWRLDVPEEIDDPTFWQEFRRRVKSLNPEAYLVGEIWEEKPEWLQGDRFDALMNYPLLEAVLGFTAGPHLDADVVAGQAELAATVRPLEAPAFAASLERLLSAYDPDVVAVQLNLLGSHDTPRFITMAGGDRAALRLATIIQMTVPGAPCIYYGDEIGMEGRADPDNRRSYPRDLQAGDLELRDFVRGAVALRRRHPALRADGAFRILAATGMICSYLRAGADGVFVVALNAGTTQAHVEIAIPEADGRLMVGETWPGWAGPLGWQPVRVEGGRLSIDVPARDALVLRAEA
jgi:cyclomaltodextrinase